jgi:hypothetical protein
LLDNESWTDITRDERFFCSHLYNAILNHERGVAGFVDLINGKCNLGLLVTDNWELGYEVCFYRDLAYRFPERYERLSPKRTFDLCLLSDKCIVIIEAKAFQGFDLAQVKDFDNDRGKIKQLGLEGVENIYLIALASSRYNLTNSKTCEYFDGNLTWKYLSETYDNGSASPLLNYADGLIKRSSGESVLPIKNEKGSI